MLSDDTNARFQTTCWTLVEDLRGDSAARRHAALDRLVKIYWAPAYAFVRRKGYGREAATELTQWFFTEKVVARRLLAKADADRGRLRTFFSRALSNFLIDQHRRASAELGTHSLPPEHLDREEAMLADGQYATPEEMFDRRWALAIFDEAMRRCEARLRQEGREAHWRAFERRVKYPALAGIAPAPMAEVAVELGFKSPALAAAAVRLVRGRVPAALREVVAETVREPHLIDEEYAWVRQLLQP